MYQETCTDFTGKWPFGVLNDMKRIDINGVTVLTVIIDHNYQGNTEKLLHMIAGEE